MLLVYPEHVLHIIEASWDILSDIIRDCFEMETNRYIYMINYMYMYSRQGAKCTCMCMFIETSTAFIVRAVLRHSTVAINSSYIFPEDYMLYT